MLSSATPTPGRIPAASGATSARRRAVSLLLVAILFPAFIGSLAVPWARAQALGVTVAGTFRYADVNPNFAPSVEPPLRPIAFAKVEIWRFRPRFLGIWSWGHDRTVVTDVNGSISEPMDFITGGIVYALRIFATNRGAIVWPNDVVHTLPFHREPGAPDGRPMNLVAPSAGVTLDFGYDFTDRWSAQHYNLAETIRQGFDYATAHRDPSQQDVLPPANVQPTSVVNSWYNPVVDTVVITSGDVFSDLLILHEYAHFLEEQISSFPWIPSRHDGCIARGPLGVIRSPAHAWMEAFASYFAQVVRRSVPPGTLNGHGILGGTFRIPRMETPVCDRIPAGTTGEAVELFVAATLWDLFDRPGEPQSLVERHDLLERRDTEIFQIFDAELDVYGVGPTISAFQAAWLGRELPCTSLELILIRHSIPSTAACT